MALRIRERLRSWLYPDLTNLGPNFVKAIWNLSGSDNLTDPYSQHNVVQAGLRAIMMNIAQVPFVIYTDGEGRHGRKARTDQRHRAWKQFNHFGQRSQREETAVSVETGPLVDLFSRPCELYPSQFLFWQAVVNYLVAGGEADIHALNRTRETDIPTAMIPYPMTTFRPKYPFEGALLPTQWEGSGAVRETLPTTALIRPRLFNPQDPVRGLSPLQAAALGLDTDWYSQLYNRNFFINDATPGFALSAPDDMGGSAARKEFMDEYNQVQQGVGKAHKTSLFWGGIKPVSIQASPKNTQVLDIRKMSREDICMVLGVPMTVISVYEDVNRATSISQDKAFWNRTLIPLAYLIEDIYWADMFRFIEGGRYWGAFDYANVMALQEDFSAKLDNAGKLYDLGYSVESINARLGLGMEDADLRPEPEPTPPPALPPAMVIEKKPEEEPKAKADDRDPHMRARKTAHAKWEKMLGRNERTFRSKYKRWLMDLRSAQLKAVERADVTDTNARASVAESQAFAQKEWQKRLNKLVHPVYETAVKDGSELAAERTGGEAMFGGSPPPAVIKAIAKREIKLASSTKTLRDNVKAEIAKGASKGETVGELQARIRQVFNFQDSRSLMIARTEMGSASSWARDEQYKADGVTGTYWLTAGDEHVRESHVACAEEGLVPLGEPFSNGLLYPLDPSGSAGEVINCRCDAMPEIGE